MTRGTALALAILLVTAGCLAPATNDPPPASPEERLGEDISVQGVSPGVAPESVFLGVRTVLGTDAGAPGNVYVFPSVPGASDGGDNGSSVSIGLRPPFWNAMGVEPDPDGIENVSAMENGLTTGLGQVVIFLGDNETTVVEYVLAHEFVHYVQFAELHDEAVRADVDVATTDGRFVYGSVMEGAAVYATDAYVRRFMDTDRRNSDLYPRIAAQLAPGSADRYRNSRYVLGNRYVAGRIDDPAALPSVYEDPPRTAEQVIHGYAPGVEPPRDLSVTVAEGTNDTEDATGGPGEYVLQGRDRMGEAWLRTALRNGVDRSAARQAAAGWGNDSLLTFRSEGGEDAYAWVIRFDDAENRSEFTSVFRDYLDARGDREGGRWSVDGWTFGVRSVGADATAVLVGPEGFAANASVEGSGGDVTVRPPATDDGE